MRDGQATRLVLIMSMVMIILKTEEDVGDYILFYTKIAKWYISIQKSVPGSTKTLYLLVSKNRYLIHRTQDC